MKLDGERRAAAPAARGWRVSAARLAHHLDRPFERLLHAATLVREAVPIGLLRRRELVALVHGAYAEVPGFYDPARYPIRYERELLPLLRELGCGPALLDLYCGHGREAEIFAGAGYRVVGVEAQEEVVRRARAYAAEAGFAAEFLTADVEAWAPSERAWDVIYSSLWMYSTVPDRVARLQWLRRVSAWLATSGVLVLSTTPRPSERRARARYVIAAAISKITLNRRRPELGDRFRHGLFWHDFAPEEVEAELRAADLRIIERLEIGGGTPCHFYIVRPAAQGPDGREAGHV